MSSCPSFIILFGTSNFCDAHLKQAVLCWKLMLLHNLQVQSSFECSNPNSNQAGEPLISITLFSSRHLSAASKVLKRTIAMPLDTPEILTINYVLILSGNV